jgi:hypothetical protein
MAIKEDGKNAKRSIIPIIVAVFGLIVQGGHLPEEPLRVPLATHLRRRETQTGARRQSRLPQSEERPW